MKAGPAWLALTLPVLVASVFLLARTISGLLRSVRGAVVASVPVAESQEVRLPGSGGFTLSVEGRLGSMDFAGVDFTLVDSAGRDVPLHTALVRSRVSSFSRARVQVRNFSVAGGGRYTLRVRNVHPGADPDNRIVLARPIGGAIAGYVIGLVLLGVLTIGSLVGSILVVVLPRRG